MYCYPFFQLKHVGLIVQKLQVINPHVSFLLVPFSHFIMGCGWDKSNGFERNIPLVNGCLIYISVDVSQSCLLYTNSVILKFYLGTCCFDAHVYLAQHSNYSLLFVVPLK